EPLALDPAERLEGRAGSRTAARAMAVRRVLEVVRDAIADGAALAAALELADLRHRELRRLARRKVIACSEVHDPLRAALAVLVLATAFRALPVGPPDPLQVVQLEHDQRDAPEEDLRLAHGGTFGAPRPGVNGPIGPFRPWQAPASGPGGGRPPLPAAARARAA